MGKSNTWNVVVAFVGIPSPDEVDKLLDTLARLHPTVCAGDTGRTEVVVICDTPDLRKVLADVEATVGVVTTLTGLTVAGVELLPTDAFDRGESAVRADELLGIPEVAKILGVSRQAVHDRCRRGTLEHARIGSVVAVPRRAVNDALERKTGKA